MMSPTGCWHSMMQKRYSFADIDLPSAIPFKSHTPSVGFGGPFSGQLHDGDRPHGLPAPTLMPRMRGLSYAVFYRPSKAIRYQHIDALFGGEIDWDLIATHMRDMIQVALSIQGVESTLFLLRFVSSVEVRQTIRAETTKIEAFNDFVDWVCFGGPVIKSGDPVEQEKQLKYASLVANTIMLSNVADLTGVLTSMAQTKHPITPDLVARLSPYMREHIRRFGQYVLDMKDLPSPLEPQPLPFEPPCDHFYTYPEPTPNRAAFSTPPVGSRMAAMAARASAT
jgi:hypothetical protein